MYRMLFPVILLLVITSSTFPVWKTLEGRVTDFIPFDPATMLLETRVTYNNESYLDCIDVWLYRDGNIVPLAGVGHEDLHFGSGKYFIWRTEKVGAPTLLCSDSMDTGISNVTSRWDLISESIVVEVNKTDKANFTSTKHPKFCAENIGWYDVLTNVTRLTISFGSRFEYDTESAGTVEYMIKKKGTTVKIHF